MNGVDLRREQQALLDDLVEHRLNNGLSQGDVAARAGVSKSSISVLENGKRSPGLLNLIRYANAIGVEITFTVKRR